MAGQKANSMQQSQHTFISALLGFQLSGQAISGALDHLAPEVAILERPWLQQNTALPRAVLSRSGSQRQGITQVPCLRRHYNSALLTRLCCIWADRHPWSLHWRRRCLLLLLLLLRLPQLFLNSDWPPQVLVISWMLTGYIRSPCCMRYAKSMRHWILQLLDLLCQSPNAGRNAWHLITSNLPMSITLNPSCVFTHLTAGLLQLLQLLHHLLNSATAVWLLVMRSVLMKRCPAGSLMRHTLQKHAWLLLHRTKHSTLPMLTAEGICSGKRSCHLSVWGDAVCSQMLTTHLCIRDRDGPYKCVSYSLLSRSDPLLRRGKLTK